MITLNYQIALTNVPFDNSYKNVMRFDTRSEQETFFNVSSLFSSDTPKVNFNVGSLMATNIVFDCAKTDNINELLNKNYCIVKDNSTNAGLDYYYYFITNAKQENENRISLSIELDIFQTYYIDLKFSDCMILRANLDRFLNTGNRKAVFNNLTTSPMHEREGFNNVAKRITNRTILSQYPNSELGNWFRDHVKAWCYVFCDPTNGKGSAPNTTPSGYKYVSASSNSTTGNYKAENTYRNKGRVLNVPSNMCCFCFPIYKNDGSTIVFTGTDFDSTPVGGMTPKYYWGNSYDLKKSGKVLLDFYNTPENGPFVYSVKISDTPPFITFNPGINYSISSTGKTLTLTTSVLMGRINNTLINTTDLSNDTMIFGEAQGSTEFQFYAMTKIGEFPNRIVTEYELYNNFEFDLLDFNNSNKDIKYNPKLLGLDFRSLRICDSSENGFDFDIQKINQKKFAISKYEPLVPDLTKKYITLNVSNDFYNAYTGQALYGYISTNDTSIPILHSAYADMLANSKNYFQQNSINRNYNLAKSTMNNIVGAFEGKPSSITNEISATADYAKSIIDENLSIDNLKNAPETLSNAKGSADFINSYSENGIIVEEYDVLDYEKELINDYMCMYGFVYNKLGNIKNFDNIRKFYNYIKADIEQIDSDTLNINNNVLNKFKKIFSEGVRFWNTDSFSYEKENYENWIDTAINNSIFVKFTQINTNLDYYATFGNQYTANIYGRNQTEYLQCSKTNGTIKISTFPSQTLNIDPSTQIQTDGTITINQISNSNLEVTYSNATFLTIDVSVT